MPYTMRVELLEKDGQTPEEAHRNLKVALDLLHDLYGMGYFILPQKDEIKGLYVKEVIA